MKTPKFWREEGVLSLALLPLSLVYWLIFRLVWTCRKENKFEIKVVCIGNLTAGGAGKTPTAIAIGKILKARNVNFAYLSSGYKGGDVDFREVNADCCAKEVGDESILLSEVAPTFVAKNRVRGVKEVQDLGYDLVILDDGMQNNNVKKDLLYVVVDGKIKFGNDMMIPAGPLRQSIRGGFKIADRIVVVGDVDDDLTARIQRAEASSKILVAEVKSGDLENFRGKKIFAFCGLGYPEKFFTFLERSGLDVAQNESFADHYDYKNSDLDLLIKKTGEGGLSLVTTKKDWVKFSKEYRERIGFLDINFTFKQEEVIVRDIEKIIIK